MLARFPDRFVVFLDEIDHTINLSYTDDFFVAIRSLFQERAAEPELRRLAFVTNKRPREYSDDTHFENISQFFNKRGSARIATDELYRRILSGKEERESLSTLAIFPGHRIS